jgi:dihydroorotase
MKQLKLTKPDDWHLHLRQGKAMSSVVGMTC